MNAPKHIAPNPDFSFASKRCPAKISLSKCQLIHFTAHIQHTLSPYNSEASCCSLNRNTPKEITPTVPYPTPITPQSRPQGTHDVHEGEDVVLHVLPAMKADHRVIYRQQHLNAVAAWPGMPPLPLHIAQLISHQVQQVGEIAQAKGWKQDRKIQWSDPQEALPTRPPDPS